MQRLDDAHSIVCFVLTESIMTKRKKKKKNGKKHVESTESPVNWIEQISCFRILRLVLLLLLVVFFFLFEFHMKGVFVCVNLIVCLNFNSWWLELMCGVWPVCVCVFVYVVISNIFTFFCTSIAFYMHADIPSSFFSALFHLFYNEFQCFFSLCFVHSNSKKSWVKPREKTSNFPWTCIYWLLYTLGFTYEMCSWFAW